MRPEAITEHTGISERLPSRPRESSEMRSLGVAISVLASIATLAVLGFIILFNIYTPH